MTQPQCEVDSLADAPQYIKLAVDLIMLLEQNDIAPQVAMDALDVVRQDLQKKLSQTDASTVTTADTTK